MSKRKKISNKPVLRSWPERFASWAVRFRVPAGAAIIASAVFLAYFPCIQGGFIFDDESILLNNPLIKASNGIYSFWCTAEAMDYWPATYSTLWVEWRLWGMHSAGYHITNLVMHVAAALLVWLILRKLSVPGAFFAAMLFAVHPVNVESAAWIASRKNLAAMLFFLLSIFWYLKTAVSRTSLKTYMPTTSVGMAPAPSPSPPAPSPSPLWYWLSLSAFMLAMLGKGSVSVLPVLLLGIVWWQESAGSDPIARGPCTVWSAKIGLTASMRRNLVRLAPFFVIAVALIGVNMWFQTRGTGIVLRTASFTERMLGASTAVWFYLDKAFLPLNLILIYPRWQIEVGNPLWWLPLTAAAIVTAVLWRYRRGWGRPFLFAWGFFCVSLAPVLGFTDVGYMRFSLLADRYQHIALIGAIALAAAGWGLWHRRMHGPARWTVNSTAALATGALMILTWQQSGFFRDALTLYEATLKKNADCPLAHYNMGVTLVQLGRTREAIEHYEKVLSLEPGQTEVHIKIGLALTYAGRSREAIEEFQKFLQSDPDNVEVHRYLGIALTYAGRAQEAMEHFQRALALKPDFAEAHQTLGVALYQSGRTQEAIEHYEQALHYKPDYPEAHQNLGYALFRTGRTQEAIEHYVEALRLNPDLPEAHNNLGLALVNSGRLQEAIPHFIKAVELRPDFPDAYSSLAMCYAQTNQPAKAVAAARKALEIARSKGQTELAGKIEEWINSHGGSRTGPQKSK
jgi:tetratricopeptide (TPR) repeat protein